MKPPFGYGYCTKDIQQLRPAPCGARDHHLTAASFLAALAALAATAAGDELRLALGSGAPIAFELDPLTCSLLDPDRRPRARGPVLLRALLPRRRRPDAAAAPAAGGDVRRRRDRRRGNADHPRGGLGADDALARGAARSGRGRLPGAADPARGTDRACGDRPGAARRRRDRHRRAGTVELGSFAATAGGLAGSSVLGIDAGAAAAVLFSIAALGRCAQLPFGAWITQTLTVPTPVSALLHAGIVNAGGLLVIATAPLLTAEPAAVALLVAGSRDESAGRNDADGRPPRRQGRAGALDPRTDGLHAPAVRARRLRRRDLPPDRPRHVQGGALPRRGRSRRRGAPAAAGARQRSARPERSPGASQRRLRNGGARRPAGRRRRPARTRAAGRAGWRASCSSSPGRPPRRPPGGGCTGSSPPSSAGCS